MECKSKKIYDKWFEKYSQFCCEKKFKINQFTSFMEFIIIISKDYVVSSIWQAASCANKNITLKRHGRWSSDTVAEFYVTDSKKSKLSVCSIFSTEKVIALEKALVIVKFLTIVPSANVYLTLNSKLLMDF